MRLNICPRRGWGSVAAAGQAPDSGDGFYNVTAGGGSWLTRATSEGLGEPLNAVVSSDSDPFVLTQAGLVDWLYSIQYSQEYGGISIGGPQAANLGDGQGLRNQTALLRYNYFDVDYGTLRESINGGSHLRFWRQNGTQTDSGAWFMAVSNEMTASEGHMIVPNGYDLGRDVLTGNATMSNGTISPITNRTFAATASFLPGFLPAESSEGINHGIATDGRVAVLTVKVTSNGTATVLSTTTGLASSTAAKASPSSSSVTSARPTSGGSPPLSPLAEVALTEVALTEVALAGLVGSFAFAFFG